MLSEQDVMKCLSAAGCYGNVKMTFESGPYSIDRPTINASKFAEQIESAVCAERDARIAELTQQLAEARKDAERYRWLRSVPNGFKAQRIVNDTPHGMDAAIDAAIKEQT